MEADFCTLLQQLCSEKVLFDNTFKLFPIKSFYFKCLCLVGFFWLLCSVSFGVGVGRVLVVWVVLLFVLGVFGGFFGIFLLGGLFFFSLVFLGFFLSLL